MKALISIRLEDMLIQELKRQAAALKLTQTEYIKQAIEQMNKKMLRQQRRERMKKASLKVRDSSMHVNMDFDGIEYEF